MKNARIAYYDIQKQLEELLLNRLINDAAGQRKRRKEKKDLIFNLSKESLENNKCLKQFTHNKPGKLAKLALLPQLE